MRSDPALREVAAYATRLTLRCNFSDMDSMRHLNNVAIARYFEEARADINMRVFGAGALVDPQGGAQLLLAAIAIEYVAQGYYPGEVEIGSGVARIGRTSFAVAHAAFQNGRCIALAESRMVKALGGRPEPLNEAERSASRGLMLARAAG